VILQWVRTEWQRCGKLGRPQMLIAILAMSYQDRYHRGSKRGCQHTLRLSSQVGRVLRAINAARSARLTTLIAFIAQRGSSR